MCQWSQADGTRCDFSHASFPVKCSAPADVTEYVILLVFLTVHVNMAFAVRVCTECLG